MKGHKVRIVIVSCAADTIIVGGAAYGNNVVIFETPVHVLEAVGFDIRMVQQNRTYLPVV